MMEEEITWLHISDIHACPNETGWDTEDIYRKLIKDLNRLKKNYSLSPKLIFITGDIMYGKKDRCGKVSQQYDNAENVIRSLMRSLGVKIDDLFIVPGNHDVNKEMVYEEMTALLKTYNDVKNIEDLLNSNKRQLSSILERLTDYKNFLKNKIKAVHLLTNPDHLIFSAKRKIAGLNIGIAGFNTAWTCQGIGPAEKDEMWLGAGWQIKTLNNEIRDCDIKIGLSHHPFHWKTEKESSDVIFMLQKYFNFHLHGHEHLTWAENLKEPNHCCIKAGALYQRKKMGKEAGYNIVRLNLKRNEGEIWFRHYIEAAGGSWEPFILDGFTDNLGKRQIKLIDYFQPLTAKKMFPIPFGDKTSVSYEAHEFSDSFSSLKPINEIGGIYEYYPQRNDIKSDYWNELFKNSKKRIFLLGHSMAPPFKDYVLEKWWNDALNQKDLFIKVIILNPYNKDLHKLIKIQTTTKVNKQLREDIFATIDRIKAIKINLETDRRKCGSDSILQVKLTDRIIYNSITLFDEKGLITLYSSKKDIGDMSPTFAIKSLQLPTSVKSKTVKKLGSGTLSYYNDEFNTFWETGTHPEELRRRNENNSDFRILNYSTKINHIRNWLASGPPKNLPRPVMIVFHPTNICSEPSGERICNGCAFITAPNKETEIKFETLRKTIAEAIKLNIRSFEFSGGGEPLEYTRITDIIRQLTEISNKKKIKCGMLTNGLFLNDEMSKLLSNPKLFAYVRFHFSEGIQNNDALKELFQRNISNFIQNNINSSTTPRIGLKFLLRKGSGPKLLNNILELKNCLGSLFQRVNHIQISPMWGSYKVRPTKQESYNFSYDFYDNLFSFPNDWPDDVQINLETNKVKPNFKCLLHPLRAVVDPTGCLFICPNYLRAYQELKFGDLNNQTIEKVWGSASHYRSATTITNADVCNTDTGCRCRFIRYHNVLKNQTVKKKFEMPELNSFI